MRKARWKLFSTGTPLSDFKPPLPVDVEAFQKWSKFKPNRRPKNGIFWQRGNAMRRTVTRCVPRYVVPRSSGQMTGSQSTYVYSVRTRTYTVMHAVQ